MTKSGPKTSRVPVIDIFAGPGGLGEGFAAPIEAGGTGRFHIALSIEKDPIAHQTLELRSLFRQFEYGAAPRSYYAHLRGEISRNALWGAAEVSRASRLAAQEAWHAELGSEASDRVADRVKLAIGRAEESVLIGGPPCQAYSLVGRSRNRGNPNYRANNDPRHTLYREYLKVLASHWPAVFVMENVKGLLSATLAQQSIFSRILDDLREPAKAVLGRTRTRAIERYRIFALSSPDRVQIELFDSSKDEPSAFVVRCEDFGIPQARHRLILLGVREDLASPQVTGLQHTRNWTAAADALRGLPRLRSGLSDQDDSAESWHLLQVGMLNQRWFLDLLESDPEVAGRIERSIMRPGHDQMIRGREFILGESVPSVHSEWYHDPRLGGVINHATRSHMAEDIQRYLFAAAFAAEHKRSPILSDFPRALLPRHRNVSRALRGGMFEDRFRVQLKDRPSTTITAHIAKDGHYYIHHDPSQCRSLTAREAARLQTFPDNYFFCGGRTAQYQQIGNAVPPLLARQIARIVSDVLR